MKRKKYIIIGNGIAGLSAAESIRKNDSEGEILMISSEKYLTYSRVKLSHYISKNFKDEDLMIHDGKWYEDRNIELMLGQLVETINTDEKQVILTDGKILNYDELLIATGSSPFIPPIDGREKEGVFALRTIEDLKNMQQYFKNCNSVTVLGGGLLGLEAAWAIKELGKEVNVIEYFPYLCPRQLDEGLSKEFGRQLEEQGLKLYLDASTEEILGAGRVEGIRLKDGSIIKTDAILISAGIRPELDLVKGTSIAFEKGIKVGNRMETNIPNVYATGDVVEYKGIVVGLWGVSSDQGKVAGENMTGGNREYHLPQITTLLNVAGISMFSAGDIKDYAETIEDHDEGKKAHYKLYITNNHVTGGVVINDMSKVTKVKKMVTSDLDLTEALEKGLGFHELIDNSGKRIKQ